MTGWQASHGLGAWAWFTGRFQPELYPQQAEIGSLFTEGEAGETEIQGWGPAWGHMAAPGGDGVSHKYHEFPSGGGDSGSPSGHAAITLCLLSVSREFLTSWPQSACLWNGH